MRQAVRCYALFAVSLYKEGVKLATQQAHFCRSYCQPSFSPEGEAVLVVGFPPLFNNTHHLSNTEERRKSIQLETSIISYN